MSGSLATVGLTQALYFTLLRFSSHLGLNKNPARLLQAFAIIINNHSCFFVRMLDKKTRIFTGAHWSSSIAGLLLLCDDIDFSQLSVKRY